jgi:hypothetical protein
LLTALGFNTAAGILFPEENNDCPSPRKLAALPIDTGSFPGPGTNCPGPKGCTLGNSEEELAPQSLGLASTGMNQDRGLRADHLIRTEDTLAGLPVDKVELALMGVNPVVEREPALIEVNDGP